MPVLQARDLLLVPNLLSAARIPLALAFPFTRGRGGPSLAILAAAGISDVLDGYFARRLGQASPVGALVDGVADKIFGVSVVGTLVAHGKLSPVAAALLATRELGELPLAARILARHEPHVARHDRKANTLGKLATSLELGTLVAAVVGARQRHALVYATAGLGLLAAFSYWRREVQNARAIRASSASARRPRNVVARPRRPSTTATLTTSSDGVSDAQRRPNVGSGVMPRG